MKYFAVKSLLLCFALTLLLCSCIGVSADITLNQNGSGTIALEYRISNTLDSLGKLDGNERWNTIPVGRADFERTLDRLPEMKLLSFFSKEDERNQIISLKMEFQKLETLLAFLDASGMRSSLKGNAGSGQLSLVLSKSGELNNPSFASLLAEISEPYSVNFSMTFSGDSSLRLQNDVGLEHKKTPKAEIISKGKKVSFSLPLYEIISSSEGITAEFSW